MIPVEILAAFFAASIVLGMTPGPDNIFVLTQSALEGRLAGVVVTFGLCTGLIAHTSAVAFGVAAIFQASEAAFSILKLAGAGYLLYLAWQAFRASASKLSMNKQKRIGLRALYRRGIIMNITNPKVSIFFLAFLPQFTDPQRGSLTIQMAILGAVFILATMLVFGGVAFLAGSIGQWLTRSEMAQRTVNRVAGTIFVGLALKLVTTTR